MHRTALVSLVLLAACGGRAQPVARSASVQATNAAAAVPATKAAPAAPVAAGPLGLPRHTPLTMTFQISAALSMVGKARTVIEQELGLPPGVLSSDLSKLGVDPRRPAAFALAPLTARERMLVAELKPAAGNPPASPAKARMALRQLHALDMTWAARVLIPASSPRRLETAMVKLLVRQKWRPVQRRPEARDARAAARADFVKRRLALELVMDDRSVALDLAAGRDAQRSLAALRAVFAGAMEPAPDLAGRSLRAIWSPAELAKSGFMLALDEIAQAVSGSSTDANMRARIAAEGLHEGAWLFTLANGPRGAWFDRVELALTAAPFEVDVRAEPGPGFTELPPAAWATSAAVTVPGAWAQVDGTRAFAAAWQFPNHGDVWTPLRQSGWMAWPVGLPQILAYAPFALPPITPQLPDKVVQRFEREAEVWTVGDHRVFVGLLPAHTPRAQAACALALGRCDAQARLVVGRVAKRGVLFAKLVAVHRRYAVLVALDPRWLPQHLDMRTVGPVHFEASTAPLTAKLGAGTPWPDRIAGDISRERRKILFRFTAR